MTAAAEELRFVRFNLWMGWVMLGCYVLFWGLMGSMIPPWSPALPASAIVAWYRESQHIFRTGMVAMMTFQFLYLVWGLGIAQVMRRVAGERSVLVEMQIWGAGLTAAVGLVTMWTWMSGTYRPEALPAWHLQYLYDSGWLIFDMTYSVTSLQMIALGVGFLQDRRAQPILPKWACWYSIWVGVMFVAECLMPFFKTGPFARDGVLNYWIEFSIFFIFFPVINIYMLKAVPRLIAEQAYAATGARAG